MSPTSLPTVDGHQIDARVSGHLRPSSIIDFSSIKAAVMFLQKGDVVALPTETVYGLAADALNDHAVNKIFSIKSRPVHHPLIVHVPNVTALDTFADWSHPQIKLRAQRLMSTLAPGPLTIIVPRQTGVAEAASGNHPTIALRLSAHPIFQAVVAHFQGLAAPSANPYGGISPTTAQHVIDDFGVTLPCIVDGGECAHGLESTIINIADPYAEPTIMRPGPISLDTLSQCLDEPVRMHDPKQLSTPATPGNCLRHYAPKKVFKSIFVNDLSSSLTQANQKNLRINLMASASLLTSLTPSSPLALMLEIPATPSMFGQKFYQILRTLDNSTADEIWIVLPNDFQNPSWNALRDRLSKALTPCEGAASRGWSS